MAKLWKPELKLYVDMHSHYSEAERKRLDKDVLIVDLPLGRFEREDFIIPFRNMFLVLIAAQYGERILIGATAGDRTLDKTPEFAMLAERALNFMHSPQWWCPEGKRFNVSVQYKDQTKEQLLRTYLAQGGDLETAWRGSFSCYTPRLDGEEPCMHCKPCFRKFVAFALCGREFPLNERERMREYLSAEIVPQILNGKYGRGPEEQDIMAIYGWLLEGKSSKFEREKVWL